MKGLLWGILVVLVVGIGGLIYRNAAEHPSQPIACPVDALVCPDGTAVSRTGNSCTFPTCPPPNVSLSDINISFAIPTGFVAVRSLEPTILVAYTLSATSTTASSTDVADIIIRRYAVNASSTPLMTIQQTAISSTSGLPIGATSFTSTVLNNHRFTVVTVDRFEGVIDTAYYLARGTDVLRFDAVDKNVANWMDANLDISTLPARVALEKLLATLQGQ